VYVEAIFFEAPLRDKKIAKTGAKRTFYGKNLRVSK